ncbi:hypothetical protein GQ53DRAFT_743151 [Thozetella sp. PMI_491]|nr:hypothetical protein GQ53DRAFT_743151 [Thozetella sp. PMI_491]
MQFTLLRPLVILAPIQATAAAPVEIPQSEPPPPRDISSTSVNCNVPTLVTELPRKILPSRNVPTLVEGPLLVKED